MPSAIRGSHHAKRASRAADELVRIEHRWHEALERNDTKTIDRVLAPGWFITNGSGQIIPKAELMHGLLAGEIRFESTKPTEVTAYVYGSAAVVTKRSTDRTMESTK